MKRNNNKANQLKINKNEISKYLNENPEDLEEILKDNPKLIASASIYQETYQGPIPHPELLKQYNEIDSDLPHRIISMAENQSNHRMKQEDKVISSDIASEIKGQNLAFILMLVSILGSIFLLYNNKNIAGFTVLIGSLASMGIVFIKGKNTIEKDLSRKDDDMYNNNN